MAVSPAALAAMMQRETGEAALVLITITHASLAVPIRVTSDGVDTVSRGNTYKAFPFRVVLASDSEDMPPRAQVEIDNVDQAIGMAIRQAQGDPPVIKAEVVLASQPNVVDAVPFELELLNTETSRLTVRGDLGTEDATLMPYPAQVFSPAQYPGIA